MAGLSQYPTPGRAIISNDWSALIRKAIRKIGITMLVPHLPDPLKPETWVEIVKEDSLTTFSRFFPNKIVITVNDETCFKKEDDDGVLWYYLRDEFMQNCKVLGIRDIDWVSTSVNNFGLGSSNLGQYYYPNFNCPVGTFLDIATLQMAADMNSLYNRGIYIEFRYPNKFCLKGIGNNNYDLSSYRLIVLVQHENLTTISPTMMETFEKLAFSDIANNLYQNLVYFDEMDTAYVTVKLYLDRIKDWADKRDSIVEELDTAHVSASNYEAPMIWAI